MKTKSSYIRQIIRQTDFSIATSKRLEHDLSDEIDARIEQGQTLDEVIETMGNPSKLAANLRASMQEEPTVHLSRTRWIFFVIFVFLALLTCLEFVGTLTINLQSVPGIPDVRAGVYVAMPDSSRVIPTYYPTLVLACLSLSSLSVFLMMQWKMEQSGLPFYLLSAFLLVVMILQIIYIILNVDMQGLPSMTIFFSSLMFVIQKPYLFIPLPLSILSFIIAFRRHKLLDVK